MRDSFCIFLLVLAFSLSLCGSVLAVDEGGTDSGDYIANAVESDEVEAPATTDELVNTDTEIVDILGNIQGYMIFFVVVLLCYFSYKFFRMFF